MDNRPHNSSVSKTKKSNMKRANTKAKSVSSVLISILIILLLTFAIVSICIIAYIISFSNGDIAINLDDYKASQNQTSIVYANNNNNKPVEIARLHGEENRIWVNIDKIPKNLQNSFVALEDKRFYKHNGVDWVRTIGVVFKYHFHQGGSTITQQLIKNLTGDNEVTFSRKFNEILYALNLEKNYSKEEILEAYLNTIPLGSGCYGVQTASKTYFGKDVSELNLAECASIASITNATTKYNPLINPNNNKERQELCLECMYEQGYINKEDYNSAKNYSLIFTNSSKYVAAGDEETAETKSKIQSYYVDFVVDSVINDLMEQYGYTKSEASRMVYYGGLKIYSCEDSNIQAAMEDVYVNRRTFPTESNRTETGENDTKKKAQSAMTVMDYTGKVVGIIGGAGSKISNRSLNRAADSPRPPGSSIKPISVYAPAVEKGIINWSTKIQNSAIIVNGDKWPKNYDKSYGDGSYVTVQYAIEKSLNTVPARLVQEMKPKTCAEFLINKFDFTTLKKADYDYSPMAVGGMREGVTTLEMASAFATFGNGGKYYSPYCYYKVTNADGSKVYLENQSVAKQAISAETSDIMNELLQTVGQTGGTGNGYAINGFTTFMKTGTTSNNYDRWLVGGTPYYVAAVWYGYDKPENISNVSGNPAGKLFKAVLDKVHTGLAVKDFTYSGLAVQKTYCTKTGLLASGGCASTAVGWYKESELPATCTSCGGGETTTAVDSATETIPGTTPGTTQGTITGNANNNGFGFDVGGYGFTINDNKVGNGIDFNLPF